MTVILPFVSASGSSRSTTPIGIVILLSFSAVVYGSDLGYAKATKEAASGRAEGGLRETGELLGDWAWQVRRLASGIEGVSQTQVELQEEQQQGATAHPMNELSTQAIQVPSDKSQNWLERMVGFSSLQCPQTLYSKAILGICSSPTTGPGS